MYIRTVIDKFREIVAWIAGEVRQGTSGPVSFLAFNAATNKKGDERSASAFIVERAMRNIERAKTEKQELVSWLFEPVERLLIDSNSNLIAFNDRYPFRKNGTHAAHYLPGVDVVEKAISQCIQDQNAAAELRRYNLVIREVISRLKDAPSKTELSATPDKEASTAFPDFYRILDDVVTKEMRWTQVKSSR